MILSPQLGGRQSQLESQLLEKSTAAGTGLWGPAQLASSCSSLCGMHSSLVLVLYLPIPLQPIPCIKCSLFEVPRVVSLFLTK